MDLGAAFRINGTADKSDVHPPQEVLFTLLCCAGMIHFKNRGSVPSSFCLPATWKPRHRTVKNCSTCELHSAKSKGGRPKKGPRYRPPIVDMRCDEA